MLFLCSPFTSIRELAKKHIGGMLGNMVSDYFRNIDHIKYVKCPVLFMHGLKDKIAPFNQSVKLFESLNEKIVAHMNLSVEMTHN